jgi:thiosulfate dehydrogenase (quinone) large subunit
LVLAWRNAGWVGLDRWLLRRLGTPWQRIIPQQSGTPG